MSFPTHPTAPVTQRFGENPKSYAFYGLRGHNGIDLGVSTGAPVHACAGG